MRVRHDAHVIARRFYQRAAAIQPAVREELAAAAQLVARRMRERVAKQRGELARSILVHDEGPDRKFVAPGMAHGYYVEKGVKPGGRGLPRFFDPESADIVAWLLTKLRAGGRVSRDPKRFSRAFQKAELTLRDAYEGLAWHIRHHGVKAQPFVEPTAREMGPIVAQALRYRVSAAVRGTGIV